MPSSTTHAVRRGASRATEAREAVAELAAQLDPAQAELVVFFASPVYDRAELAAALAEHFSATQVIGCTTAGEFGPAGYGEGTLSGFSFRRGEFSFEVGRLDALQELEIDAGTHAMQAAMELWTPRRLAGQQQCMWTSLFSRRGNSSTS